MKEKNNNKPGFYENAHVCETCIGESDDACLTGQRNENYDELFESILSMMNKSELQEVIDLAYKRCNSNMFLAKIIINYFCLLFDSEKITDLLDEAYERNNQVYLPLPEYEDSYIGGWEKTPITFAEIRKLYVDWNMAEELTFNDFFDTWYPVEEE